MRLREMWILGLGLAWWCAPAYATPFRDVSGGNEEHQGVSPLHSKASRPSKSGWRSEGSWQAPVGSPPPGLEKKGDLRPPGLVVVNDDFLLPEDQPASAGLIPEPTGLILFGGGLLLVVASERRRRSS